MFIMFNMYVHVCVHLHACMHGTLPHTFTPMHAWDTPPHIHTHPSPIHPSTTPRGTSGIGQNSITLELIKIFQFRLKI